MIDPAILDGLRELQALVGKNSRDHGFRKEGDNIRMEIQAAEQQPRRLAELQVQLRNYYANRLMLIVGEIAEAHEEIRKGRGMLETYYSGGAGGHDLTETEPTDANGDPRKPEGFPSEAADILIRLLDLTEEMTLDLGVHSDEKMTYNASREFMHGKQF